MLYVDMNIGTTSGCCGVHQLTDFSNLQPSRSWRSGPLVGEGETAKAAYEDLFRKLREFDFTDGDDDGEDYEAAVCQIWFYKGHDYKGKDNETYEAEDLRLLIETIPNVRNLGEYRNPNTNNLIQGYQWAI